MGEAGRNIVDVEFTFVLENAEILRHKGGPQILIAKQPNLWFLSLKKEIEVSEKRKYLARPAKIKIVTGKYTKRKLLSFSSSKSSSGFHLSNNVYLFCRKVMWHSVVRAWANPLLLSLLFQFSSDYPEIARVFFPI